MISITVAMIAAPSLGIYIYQHMDFSILIIFSTVLGSIALLLFSLIRFRTPSIVQENQKRTQRFSLRESLIDRNSLFPALVTLCASIGNGSIVTFIVIFGAERGLEQIFLFYFFNALMATLVRPVTGKWFDRNGPWSLIILCSLLGFISLWVLAFSYSSLMLIISGMLFGIGYGSMIPALQAWVLSITTEEKSGTANGMFYSAIDLGVGLSALLLGLISRFVDTAQLFIITSFFFLLGTILVTYDWLRSGKRNKIPIYQNKDN